MKNSTVREKKMNRREIIDMKFGAGGGRRKPVASDLVRLANRYADMFLGLEKEMIKTEEGGYGFSGGLPEEEEPGQKYYECADYILPGPLGIQ